MYVAKRERDKRSGYNNGTQNLSWLRRDVREGKG